SALRRLAIEMAVPLRSAMIAAHAKVLGALSGQREIRTGYVAAEGRPALPCRVSPEPRSGRAMILAAHRAESELISHAEFPLEALGHDMRLPRPPFETVLDPAPVGSAALTEGIVLRIDVLDRGAVTLRFRYRTDVLDRDSVRRIAGYHLRALAL